MGRGASCGQQIRALEWRPGPRRWGPEGWRVRQGLGIWTPRWSPATLHPGEGLGVTCPHPRGYPWVGTGRRACAGSAAGGHVKDLSSRPRRQGAAPRRGLAASGAGHQQVPRLREMGKEGLWATVRRVAGGARGSPAAARAGLREEARPRGAPPSPCTHWLVRLWCCLPPRSQSPGPAHSRTDPLRLRSSKRSQPGPSCSAAFARPDLRIPARPHPESRARPGMSRRRWSHRSHRRWEGVLGQGPGGVRGAGIGAGGGPLGAPAHHPPHCHLHLRSQRIPVPGRAATTSLPPPPRCRLAASSPPLWPHHRLLTHRPAGARLHTRPLCALGPVTMPLTVSQSTPGTDVSILTAPRPAPPVPHLCPIPAASGHPRPLLCSLPPCCSPPAASSPPSSSANPPPFPSLAAAPASPSRHPLPRRAAPTAARQAPSPPIAAPSSPHRPPPRAAPSAAAAPDPACRLQTEGTRPSVPAGRARDRRGSPWNPLAAGLCSTACSAAPRALRLSPGAWGRTPPTQRRGASGEAPPFGSRV